jgi:hypothetical protein
MKRTVVKLEANGRVVEFEPDHAERLLRMPNNGGWKIAKGEKLELTENGFKPTKD